MTQINGNSMNHESEIHVNNKIHTSINNRASEVV